MNKKKNFPDRVGTNMRRVGGKSVKMDFCRAPMRELSTSASSIECVVSTTTRPVVLRPATCHIHPMRYVIYVRGDATIFDCESKLVLLFHAHGELVNVHDETRVVAIVVCFEVVYLLPTTWIVSSLGPHHSSVRPDASYTRDVQASCEDYV